MFSFWNEEDKAKTTIQNLPRNGKEIAIAKPYICLTSIFSIGFSDFGNRIAPDLQFLVGTKDSIQIIRLCYNAAHMKYQIRFANNNNNDNDDLRIVGRSFAG